MDIKDKVVVITGASKGLGRELAVSLAKENVKLALIARSEDELKQLKSNNTDYFLCDITQENQVHDTLQKIYEKFGRIDILINNAGVWHEGRLEDHSADVSKKLFDVIVLGTIFCTRAVLPYMKAQKSGQILNVISVGGLETPGSNGQYSVYTAAKFAVTGFTKSMIEELKGSGIKVMGFYPAGMNTGFFKSAGFNYSDNEDWMMDKKDIAEIVVFMLKRPIDVLMDQVVVHKFNG
jgi:short-subunit dehydrogenase